MIVSYNWLKSYMKNPEAMPTKERIAEIFTLRAFEIESIEEKNGDTIYDLKVLPDRSPYAYGIRYVALELSLFVPELICNSEFLSFAKTHITIDESKYAISPKLVRDIAQEFCPVYTLTRIENIHNNPSPQIHVEALQSLGQQSRGAVVDLTNLVMYDTGQPLHAFDADKVEGDIHVKVLDVDKEVEILGGKKVPLKKGMLVIADDKDVLAIAGVKGCVKAEVTAETKNIYLESASFNRVAVRKTSRALDIINDSSKRFEQGVTKERTLLAVERFIQKIKDLIPEAVIHTTEMSVNPNAIFSEKLKTIDVNVERCIKLITRNDEEIKNKFIHFLENIFPKTGADVEKKHDDEYRITAPLYRADLQAEADVIDEFIRSVGYDIIPYRKTQIEDSINQEKKYTVLKAVRKILTEKGFTEVLLHTLVDSKKNSDAVVLENALTSERDSLRALLAPEMENAIVKNFPYLDIVGKSSVNLFEIGHVFGIIDSKIKQTLHLAIGVGMPKQLKKKGNIQSISPLLQELFPNASVVKIIETETVYIVEVDITDHIESSALATKLKTEYLSQNARIKSLSYKKASIYPSMSRDIAFFVEGNEKSEVEETIKNIVQAEPLIETTTLFDEFSKEGKTSYGYRFVFQSYEKTLTEEEVNGIMTHIASQIQIKGWTVR